MTTPPTRRTIALRRIVQFLRDRHDPLKATRIDSGDFAWLTDRTIDYHGVRYTDADCGCVIVWVDEGGPAVIGTLNDCCKADHFPPRSVAQSEACAMNVSGETLDDDDGPVAA